MVWHPTGLYRENTHNNFPPQFTSEVPAVLSTVPAPYDASTDPFTTYARDSGGSLGLWWGRSMQIAEVWDDPVLDPLDWTDETHWVFRDDELGGAVDLSADEIGLDAFSHVGMWESYWVVSRDQAHYPALRFITEPMHGDFVHTIAPSYEIMTQNPGSVDGEIFQLPDGLLMADFLVPGHETWGMIEVRWLKVKLGYPSGHDLDPEEARTFIRQAAAMGLVPTYFGAPPTVTLPDEFDAAESWLDTVPAELLSAPL